MKAIASAAAGAAALLVLGCAGPAAAQCWWTGFNYGCTTPSPYLRSYDTVSRYWYGWPATWWLFRYVPPYYPPSWAAPYP